MNKVRLSVAIISLLFMGGTYAGYSGHGHTKLKVLSPFLAELGETTFYVESVDWDDSRPLICLDKFSNNVLCIVSLDLDVNGTPNFFPQINVAAYTSELKAANVKTVGQYFRYLQSKNMNVVKPYNIISPSGNVSINGSEIKNVSFCMTIAIHGVGSYRDSLICGLRVIPEVVGCNIQESQLFIDHGTLSANTLNGHMATGELTVRCDGNGSAKLMAPNPEPKLLLASDGSLFTSVTVDGKPLAEGVVVNAGPAGTRVTLTSTLGTVGTPKAGQFSGSMVVVLAKP